MNRTTMLGGKRCPHSQPFGGHNCDRCRDEPGQALAADELRAAIASLWQPISTAPKDGTHIIVVSKGMLPATVHWFDGAWQLSVNQRGEFSEYVWQPPTHWMPASELRNPPSAGDGGRRNAVLDIMRAKCGNEPLSYVELGELEKVPAGEIRAFLIARLVREAPRASTGGGR